MQWELKLLDGSTIIGDECYEMSYMYEIIKIHNRDLSGYIINEKDWTYDIFTVPYNEVVYMKRTGLTRDDYIEHTIKMEQAIKNLEEEFRNKSEQDKIIDETEPCEKCKTEEYKSLPITDDSMYI